MSVLGHILSLLRAPKPVTKRESTFPKSCACGRISATREAFAELPWVGFQDDGDGGLLALRWVECCGTIAVPAVHDNAATRRVA